MSDRTLESVRPDETIVQVATRTNDYFHVVKKARLVEVARQCQKDEYSEEACETAKKAFLAQAEYVAVTHTNACDYSLVFDGENDSLSWGELCQELDEENRVE